MKNKKHIIASIEIGTLVLDYGGAVGWIAAIEPYMKDEIDICLVEWFTKRGEPVISYMSTEAAQSIRENYLKHKESVLNGTYEYSTLLPIFYPSSSGGGDGI